MRLTMFVILAAVLALVVTSVVGVFNRGGKAPALSLIGSTSIQPFAEMLAEEFNKKEEERFRKEAPSPNRKAPYYVEVQGGGSTAGLQAVANGVAEIGMCSRKLKKEEEPSYDPIQIARDGLAIVVHKDNPVSNLSRKDIESIFVGTITNWKHVGGRDGVIRTITREEGSGTREAFSKLVMHEARISRKALTQESNGAVKELVIHDPAAIGYMSLGLVGDELKMLQIDGVEASRANAADGKYPFVRPFLFVHKKGESLSDSAKAYIDFVLSKEGQDLLEKEGLIGTK